MALKQKNEFKMPYVGIDETSGRAILYGEKGDFSVIFKLNNLAIQYGADPEPYNIYQHLLLNVIKIVGEGYIIQKHDVFSRKKYKAKKSKAFLQEKYNEHFQGREYTSISTYLTLTRVVKRSAFYVYDAKVLSDFLDHVAKIYDLFNGSGLDSKVLTKSEIQRYIARILAMEFSSDNLALDNFLAGNQQLTLGKKSIKSISLVDTDSIDLPEQVGAYTEKNDGKNLRDFPVDNLSFLHFVPDYNTIIFNQVIEIPNQQLTLSKLELKRKRHSGVPDPTNLMCCEDIDHLLVDVARENQLLVNAHYNIIVSANTTNISKATNFIEAALFQQGIIPSRNAYNQLELFRTALPGNAVELKKYDWFLTTSDAALCFFFKDTMLSDEDSDFLIRFTDRQGIPVAIDPSDLVMRNNRVNNRNRFICGPSGSGKSMCLNAILEQYLLYNMDVVIVDVGHSYSGLCSYYGGKYITYSEEKPITMNPFFISESEYNIEKKDFLITLISLLWKGAEGTISTVERDVIADVISAYYAVYFKSDPLIDDNIIRILQLNFDSFYEFALEKIPEIKTQDNIRFDLEEFRFVLKKFYCGGEYESILNEPADASLFGERLIVYEIDNIQNNRILFPIITLIIMDLFIQKMRHRTHQRKTLVLEECWKAIASPMMANFLLYLNKTVRKFYGEVIEVTQSLSDVLGNPILKECIISESDTIILLDQTKFKNNYEEIAKLLSLSETEQKKIFTINNLDNKEGRGRFKEVYIRRGSLGEVYGVELSIYQYLVFTTEKPEKTAIETYVRESKSYREGLERFVKDMEECGLSLSAFVNRVNQKENAAISN